MMRNFGWRLIDSEKYNIGLWKDGSHARSNEVYTDEVGRTLSEPIEVKKLCIGPFIEYRFFSSLM